MQRLSRAGRKDAIMDAIRRLERSGKKVEFTKGEICRKMGIKSTSKIRDILREMVDAGRLVSGTTAIDGYADEVEVFGIARYCQTPLPEDHIITINGVSCRMSDVELYNDMSSECRNCGKPMYHNERGMCSECWQVWNG